MVQFCPTCKSLLIPRKQEDGSRILHCQKCDVDVDISGGESSYISSQRIRHDERDETIILEGADIDTLPTENVECPKCGNNVAVYWQTQTRSADEPMTTFYRCKKCKHTWRDYSD